MTQFKVKSTIFHNGKKYKAGSTIELQPGQASAAAHAIEAIPPAPAPAAKDDAKDKK